MLDFGNPAHLIELEEMGITFQFQDGGKVVLTHRPEKVSYILLMPPINSKKFNNFVLKACF